MGDGKRNMVLARAALYLGTESRGVEGASEWQPRRQAQFVDWEMREQRGCGEGGADLPAGA